MATTPPLQHNSPENAQQRIAAQSRQAGSSTATILSSLLKSRYEADELPDNLIKKMVAIDIQTAHAKQTLDSIPPLDPEITENLVHKLKASHQYELYNLYSEKASYATKRLSEISLVLTQQRDEWQGLLTQQHEGFSLIIAQLKNSNDPYRTLYSPAIQELLTQHYTAIKKITNQIDNTKKNNTQLESDVFHLNRDIYLAIPATQREGVTVPTPETRRSFSG